MCHKFLPKGGWGVKMSDTRPGGRTIDPPLESHERDWLHYPPPSSQQNSVERPIFNRPKHFYRLTEEEIAERCARLGIPLEEIPHLNDFWLGRIAYGSLRMPSHHISPALGWRKKVFEDVKFGLTYENLAFTPYPPGVEFYSPEYIRIMNRRQTDRQWIKQGHMPIFIEGFTNLDTYKPIYSPIRPLKVPQSVNKHLNRGKSK